ncbi:MAG: serine--glyoxylate aminotransferase, partial [Alphaproteobacteria bacterium]|nr:serine--glyoxylate aminotransferase [Alphaproteobacteria bacterium]
EGFDARDVISTAYSKYNTSLGSGLSKVAGKVFRIGHLGWLNEGMVCTALSVAEMALIDTGIKIEAGSGVGAAITHYSQTSADAAQKKAAA